MSHYYYISPEEYLEAQFNGISSTLLETRIRTLAWDKERAISTPPLKKVSIKEWVPLAEQNGICYSTLRYRINRLGWDPERAATQPLQDRKKQAKKAHESSRKYPKKMVELANHNGISYDMFQYRVKHGWDIYEAATRPKMSSREIGLLTKDKRKINLPRKRRSIL